MQRIFTELVVRLFFLSWSIIKFLGPDPMKLIQNPTPISHFWYRVEMYFSVYLLHIQARLREKAARRISNIRLNAMLKEAQLIPYWNERLTKPGYVHPGPLTDLEPITKNILRNIPLNKLSSEPRLKQITWRRTSGTSGEPFVWGFDIPTLIKSMTPAYMVGLLQRASVPLSKRPWVIAINMPHGQEVTPCHPVRIDLKFTTSTNRKRERSDLEVILKTLEKTGRRRILYGYPSELLIFAQALSQHDLIFEVEAVITTGQHLEPGAREAIQTLLKTRVHSFYTTRELGPVAYECVKQNDVFHICSERIIVEFFNEELTQVQKDEGVLVFTALDQGAMPLIRYAIGDTAQLKKPEGVKCICGLRSASIIFSGRTMDYLTLKDGTRIPARRIRSALLSSQFINKIRRFQAKEGHPGTLEITVDTYSTKPFDPSEESILIKKLKQEIDAKLDVTFIYNSLPSMGKFKDFIPHTKDDQ